MSSKPQYVQRGQEQARAAWNWVEAATKENKKFRDRYATLARKLPGYVQVSGLGQTMAFLYAKGDKPGAEQTMRDQIGGYLQKQLDRRDRGVMNMIVELDPDTYRRATRELMQVLDWLKRFAEGRLGTGSQD